MRLEFLEALLYDWHCDRRLKSQTRDVPFFSHILCRYVLPHGRVTVLGCGTGRVAIPLARAGWRVTGIDISPGRLALARAKASGTGAPEWQLGDMRDFAAEPRQDAVLVPYSAFLLLQTDADRLACLRSIRGALKPGSVAIIDVSPNFSSKPDRRRAFAFGAWSPQIRGWVDYFETIRQQPRFGQTLIGRRYRIRFDAGDVFRVAYLERWRSLTPPDAQDLVGEAGLRIVNGFADYRGASLFAAGKIVPGAAKHIYVISGR